MDYIFLLRYAVKLCGVNSGTAGSSWLDNTTGGGVTVGVGQWASVAE